MIINLPESNYPLINGFTSFVHKAGGLTVMWIVIGLALLAFLTFFAYALLDSHTRVLYYATRIFGVGFLCVAGLWAVDSMVLPNQNKIEKYMPILNYTNAKVSDNGDKPYNYHVTANGKKMLNITWIASYKMKVTPVSAGGKSLLNANKYAKQHDMFAYAESVDKDNEIIDTRNGIHSLSIVKDGMEKREKKPLHVTVNNDLVILQYTDVDGKKTTAIWQNGKRINLKNMKAGEK